MAVEGGTKIDLPHFLPPISLVTSVHCSVDGYLLSRLKAVGEKVPMTSVSEKAKRSNPGTEKVRQISPSSDFSPLCCSYPAELFWDHIPYTLLSFAPGHRNHH